MNTQMIRRISKRTRSVARRRLFLERFESRDFFDGAGAAVMEAPPPEQPTEIVSQPNFSFNSAANGNLLFGFGASYNSAGFTPLPPLSSAAESFGASSVTRSFDSIDSVFLLSDSDTTSLDWFASQNSAIPLTLGSSMNLDSASNAVVGTIASDSDNFAIPGMPQITSQSAGLASVVDRPTITANWNSSSSLNIAGNDAPNNVRSSSQANTEKPGATAIEARRASLLLIPTENRVAATQSRSIDVAALSRQTPPLRNHILPENAVRTEIHTARTAEPHRGIVRAMEIAHTAHLRRRAEIASAVPVIAPEVASVRPKLDSREIPRFEPVFTSSLSMTKISEPISSLQVRTSHDSRGAAVESITLVDRAAHAWHWFMERGMAAAIDLGRRLPQGTFAAAVVTLAVVAASPQKSPAKEEVDRDPKRFGSGRNENE